MWAAVAAAAVCFMFVHVLKTKGDPMPSTPSSFLKQVKTPHLCSVLAVWYTCLWCMHKLTRAFGPGPGILTSETAVSSSSRIVSSPQARSLHPCGANGRMIPSTRMPTRTPSQVLSSASISDSESGCNTLVVPSARVCLRTPRLRQQPRSVHGHGHWAFAWTSSGRSTLDSYQDRGAQDRGGARPSGIGKGRSAATMATWRESLKETPHRSWEPRQRHPRLRDWGWAQRTVARVERPLCSWWSEDQWAANRGP